MSLQHSAGHVAVAAGGAGVVLGLLYTLSPATVLILPVLGLASWWAGRGLSARERQWFVAVLVIAVVARLAFIAALFLFADPREPYATFFGDEQFFKNRTLWMRNIFMGIPTSRADFLYAYDDVGQSSYLYILAYGQALVGAVPYGVHVVNAVLYLAAMVILYRHVRAAYGGVPAMAGLVVLLFLPSLFVWSISALKEPMYTFVAAIELVCALYIGRATGWPRRALAVAGVVAAAVALESLRKGGLLVAGLGTIAGLAAGLTFTRPRRILAKLVLVTLVGAVILSRPDVQGRLLGVARDSAFYHSGHVVSSGYSYKILDPRFYWDRRGISSMPPREAAVFVARSLVSFVSEPLPWRAESALMRAYLPEQMLWLLLLAFVPIGLVAGLKRDALLTAILAAHACAAILIVALTSGNIGTLIRHRGLALPYLAWLAALGAYELVRVATDKPEGLSPHGFRAHGSRASSPAIEGMNPHGHR